MTLLRWVLPDSLELSAYLDQRAREVRGADGVLEAGVHLGFGCIVVSETDVLSNNNYVRTFNMV